MTEFYTADLHLFHPKVAELRGFNSARSHDIGIMARIFSTMKPGDTLHILGDLSQDKYTDNAMRLVLSSLHFYRVECHLIAGNHDDFHPLHRNAHKSTAYGAFDFMGEPTARFASVRSVGTTKIASTRAILSHFPYTGDHTKADRYTQWPPRDMGAPIIHGHTHATTPVSYSTNGTLQVCVSLDAWGLKPVAKHELDTLITKELQREQHS